jgi:hypothetical protein
MNDSQVLVAIALVVFAWFRVFCCVYGGNRPHTAGAAARRMPL